MGQPTQGPDPGQKQDTAKVRTYAPTPFKFSRCWCRGSALKPPSWSARAGTS